MAPLHLTLSAIYILTPTHLSLTGISCLDTVVYLALGEQLYAFTPQCWLTQCPWLNAPTLPLHWDFVQATPSPASRGALLHTRRSRCHFICGWVVSLAGAWSQKNGDWASFFFTSCLAPGTQPPWWAPPGHLLSAPTAGGQKYQQASQPTNPETISIMATLLSTSHSLSFTSCLSLEFSHFCHPQCHQPLRVPLHWTHPIAPFILVMLCLLQLPHLFSTVSQSGLFKHFQPVLPLLFMAQDKTEN